MVDAAHSGGRRLQERALFFFFPYFFSTGMEDGLDDMSGTYVHTLGYINGKRRTESLGDGIRRRCML